MRPTGASPPATRPGLNDGAAALVLASRSYAEARGHRPLARVVASAQAALAPAWISYAPVKAIPLALQRAGWEVDDVDLFEINEAFAAQVLADMKGLEREGFPIPLDKVNVHGGAIALGHPLGASGARVLVTLAHALRRRGLKRGLAALCLRRLRGGGHGDRSRVTRSVRRRFVRQWLAAQARQQIVGRNLRHPVARAHAGAADVRHDGDLGQAQQWMVRGDGLGVGDVQRGVRDLAVAQGGFQRDKVHYGAARRIDQPTAVGFIFASAAASIR